MSSSLECSQTSIKCEKQSFHVFNGRCELNFETCDCIKDSNATVSIIQPPLMCFGAFRQYEMTKWCWAAARWAKWPCWLILWVYFVCSQLGEAKLRLPAGPADISGGRTFCRVLSSAALLPLASLAPVSPRVKCRSHCLKKLLSASCEPHVCRLVCLSVCLESRYKRCANIK